MKRLSLILLTTVCLCFFSLKSQSYKNLAIEGGGLRGIAYPGALEVLGKNHLLDSLQTVAGSSAGSIVAMLMATGYSADSMVPILMNKSFSELNDGRFFFIGGGHRLFTRFGWYKGALLKQWFEELQFRQTGIAGLTFKQLDSLKQHYPNKYKNLRVVVTNLSLQRYEVLSAQTSPQMPVSLAVAASCSIPMYFQPVLVNSQYQPVEEVQGKVAPGTFPFRDTFMLCDGGLMLNYPYRIFAPNEGLTLGLKVDNGLQYLRHSATLQTRPIHSLGDYLTACYDLSIEAQNTNAENAIVIKHTVLINTGDFSPRVRKLSKAEINRLLLAGSNGAENFVKQR